MQLRHRYIKFRAVRVINLKAFGGPILGVQRDQPLIAPDAMLHVDHGVPDPEFREIPDHRVDVCLPVASPHVAAGIRLVELGLRHHCDLRLIHQEAVIKRPVGDRERGIRVDKRAEPRHPVRGKPILTEEFENRLFSPGGRRGNEEPPLLSLRPRAICLQRLKRILRSPVNGEIGEDGRSVSRCHKFPAGKGAERLEERFRRQEELFWGQRRMLGVMRKELVPRLGLVIEPLKLRVHVSCEEEPGVLSYVIKNRRCLVKEKRQIVFAPRARNVVCDVLIDGRPGAGFREGGLPVFAEREGTRFIDRELAPGENADAFCVPGRMLRVFIKHPDRFDLVIEESDPVRVRRAHRVDIDDFAADTEFTRPHHLRNV